MTLPLYELASCNRLDAIAGVKVLESSEAVMIAYVNPDSVAFRLSHAKLIFIN